MKSKKELEKIAIRIAGFETRYEKGEISQEEIEKEILNNTKDLSIEDFMYIDNIVHNLLVKKT